ncbi:MAG: tetratricopeptide repeat protein [Actinomycetota bacterium]
MPLFDQTKKAIARAVALRRAGDAPGAIDALAAVLDEDAENTTANVEIARALRLIGDPKEAEEYLRRALKVVLDYQLIVELAQVVAEQGRVNEAEKLVDAAWYMAEKNPRLDPGEALLVRAAIAAGRGKNDKALATLDRIRDERDISKRTSPQVKRFAERLRASLVE